jgi:tRNA-2-methylthio-N6-dimethylallyladenosine synthase
MESSEIAMPPKSLFIHTIGCQMNVYDSERMAALLAPLGYGPAFSAEDASLVIVNTCSVRDKAEQKAFSILGRLEAVKTRRPGLIVAVAGCVAQQEGARVLARAPHVDIVLGTGGLGRLPELVRRVEACRGPVVDVDPDDGPENFHAPVVPAGGGPVARFVTVMRGCDNFCAYCVVPHVRGPETSRPPDSILEEIERLVAVGAREITLLGQNVNSYGVKEGLCTFAGLLERVNAVPGLLRIRFTTSHPKDLTPELIRAFARLEKLCPHIHLPVQSGSDLILERMNRRYTRERYLDIISKLRDSCSEIAITSDVIVGFPGETAADFEATLDLIRQVQFDGLFAFMYSDRPHATSARLSRKVPAAEKRERLQALLALQEGITFRKNRSLVGTLQEILVEGESKRQAAGTGADDCPVQWTGRTRGNKIVNFHCNPGSSGPGPVRPGRLLRVRIERALAHSLRGVHEDDEGAAPGPKGDMNHAS